VINAQNDNPTQYSPVEQSPQRSFIQDRLHKFGLNMLVMGASFALYYLGFFGGVDGPLKPDRIGERLAALGFSNRSLLIVLLAFMVIAITWNWLYNGINRLLGRRMTCLCRLNDDNALCALPVRQDSGGQFVCSAGHTRNAARFNPVKKGTVAHFIWMMFLVLSAIVFYLS